MKFEAIVLGNASNANSANLAVPAVVSELERNLLRAHTCFRGDKWTVIVAIQEDLKSHDDTD